MMRYALMIYILLEYGMIESHGDIHTGFLESGKDDAFFTKFSFRSTNSTLKFSFAYPEIYAPLNMRIFWDSPISWVDCFNLRLPCLRKQEILRQLSSGQTISLDPNMNSWCQTITLSSEILNEMDSLPFVKAEIDWSSIISDIVRKLSSTVTRTRSWLASFGLTNDDPLKNHDMHLLNSSSVPRSARQSLPGVVQLAWKTHMNALPFEEKKQAFNWIYCSSPEIPLIFHRPVWWFFTLERCEATRNFLASTEELLYPQSPTGIQSAFRMEFRNGLAGDLFHEQFSAQNFGMLELDMLFFVVMCVLLLCSTLVIAQLYRIHMLHPMAVLWYLSLVLRFLAQMTHLGITINLALSGLPNYYMSTIVQFLVGSSSSLFFAALLLLSCGYLMLHRTITPTQKAILLLALSVYTLVNIACLIATEFLQYTGDVLSRYHSPATYVLTACQLAACAGYVANTGYTIFKWPEKRLFMIRTAVVSSVWFWYIPLWICITVELAAKQYTETVIRVWDEIVNVTAYVLFLLLLRPQNANAVFPYHTRTTEATTREPQQGSKAGPSALSEPPKIIKPAETPRSGRKLPPIGGRPGDLPAPGHLVAKTLSHLEERPRTTPGRIRGKSGTSSENTPAR